MRRLRVALPKKKGKSIVQVLYAAEEEQIFYILFDSSCPIRRIDW